MKVIDLLNKIANGEEVPDAIKYKGNIYGYDGENLNYVRPLNYTFDLLIGEDVTAILNEEVEIIEEDKKIEKFEFGEIEDREHYEIKQKINKIIDKIYSMEDK